MKNIIDTINTIAARHYNIALNDVENAIRNALRDGDAHAIEVVNPHGRVAYEIVYNDCFRDFAAERIAEMNRRSGWSAEEVSVKVAMYNSKKLVKEYNK